jgi:hypothetical protein
MFSKKIIIKHLKIAFVAIYIPIVFHGLLENFITSWTTIKNCFFFHLAMDHNTSLDSEKKNSTRLSLKNYMCPFKKKSWLSLAIENNAKKKYFMAVL